MHQDSATSDSGGSSGFILSSSFLLCLGGEEILLGISSITIFHCDSVVGGLAKLVSYTLVFLSRGSNPSGEFVDGYIRDRFLVLYACMLGPRPHSGDYRSHSKRSGKQREIVWY